MKAPIGIYLRPATSNRRHPVFPVQGFQEAIHAGSLMTDISDARLYPREDGRNEVHQYPVLERAHLRLRTKSLASSLEAGLA
jgi:hypothetical protein